MSASDDDGGLRPLFRLHLPVAHWSTIETGAVARGVPDAEYCFKGGVQGWVEFKACRRGWAVRMRPEQVAWLTRRARYGGRAWVAVRRLAGCDDLYLYRAADAALVLANGCRCGVHVVHMQGGPGRWNWSTVEETIRS